MAAHDGNNGISARYFLRLLQMIQMSVMKRVVFDNESDCAHLLDPLFVKCWLFHYSTEKPFNHGPLNGMWKNSVKMLTKR
jgi:hypothetical protein